MSDEILVNVTPRETRVALVENGLLQELHVERASKRGLVGNIYIGKVIRILPGMQAAFIDVGLERTAFLHASDIFQADQAQDNADKTTRDISSLLHDGQHLLVQVFKDPLGSKGARLTTQLSIPSRYLVFMSGMTDIGISQKIEVDEERQRLKDIVQNAVDKTTSRNFIIRTVAEGASEQDILEDMDFLNKLWISIEKRTMEKHHGELIYQELPLAIRVLRDMPEQQIDKVRIDSREAYQNVINFVKQFIPKLESRIEHYPGARPIFDLYSVDDEIHKALDRKVILKSGGHLVFDQTEAMTTIDINTGAFVGHRNLEETIFKTNLEATQAIARQLRLRNLGGIIIIDFIDMLTDEHKSQILRELEKSLASDRAKHHICDVSPLGLVEMTRQRSRESLEHILCEPCPVCTGTGSIKRKDTTCYEIFREIMREARQFDTKKFLVIASQEVIDMLLEDEASSIAELEEFIGIPVKLQVESSYTQGQYDVVLL